MCSFALDMQHVWLALTIVLSYMKAIHNLSTKFEAISEALMAFWPPTFEIGYNY